MVLVEILEKCLLLKIDKGERLVQLTKQAQNGLNQFCKAILIQVLFMSIDLIFFNVKDKCCENIWILECEKNNSSPESILTNCEALTRALKLAKNGNAIDVDNKEMSQWVEIKSERDFQFLSFSRVVLHMRSKIV